MKVLVEKNPIMKEIYYKYNNFVKDDNLTEAIPNGKKLF